MYDNKTDFCNATAGRHHHNYPGGLIEHTYGVLSTSIFICQKYQNGCLDLALVMAGAIFHDIGKMETSLSLKTETLLPHPIMSVLMAKPYLDTHNLTESFKQEIYNCISTHMLNEREDTPLGKIHMLEGYIIHQADGLDAYLKKGISELCKVSPGDCTDNAFPQTVYKSDNLAEDM